MGYYTCFSGEIAVNPPLPWGEIKDSPWLTSDHGGLMFRLDSEVIEHETDEGVGSFTRKTAVGIVPVTEEETKFYGIVSDLQEIIDAFPGRTFTGYISAEGEDTGDLWRLAIRDGRAVKVTPRIIWDES